MKREKSTKCTAKIEGTVTRLECGFMILYNQQMAKEFKIIADGCEECVFALISQRKCTVEGSFSILEGDLLDAYNISLVNGTMIDLENYKIHYKNGRKEILVKNSASFSGGDMKGKVNLRGRFGYYKGDIVFYEPEGNIIYKSYRQENFHYIYFTAKEVQISGNVDSDGNLKVNGISVINK